MDVALGKITRLIIDLPPRNGKQIADSTPVPTTDGWKTHGELKIGDYVFSQDGKPIKVIAISPKTISNIKIKFTDGSQIICHENHEWMVFNRGDSTWNLYDVKSLQKTYTGKPRKFISGTKKPRATYQIPPRPRLYCHEQKLIIHPYVLGAWLGDGSASKPCITHSPDETEVIDRIKEIGYNISAVCTHKITGVLTTYFSSGKRGLLSRLRRELREVRVEGNKHIPEIYKISSVEQRLELLAGLIDTDGHVGIDNRVIIVTGSKKLAEDIADIIRSLGWRAGIHTQEPILSTSGIQGKKIIYYIGFTPDGTIPTNIPRKAIINFPKAQRRIGIKSITKIEQPKEFGHCIQVDSKDGLYVIGRELIVTHNSMLISQYFPAWYLGKFPDNRIILASYEADFAASWGRKARDLVEEFGPEYFNINVRGTSSAAHRWDLEGYNGGMITAGAGGAISGKGANLFLIDDPIKNQDEAYSKLQRDRIWEWYRSVVYTRLDTTDSAIILMMTRWHSGDLAGRLIKEMDDGGEAWTVVSIPAIAEKDDLLNRAPGEPLWPERFPLETLMRIKGAIGSEWWSALYQQRPISQTGVLFKRQNFRYFERDGELYKLYDNTGKSKNIRVNTCWTFQTCDPAASTRTTADYFVLATWAVTPDHELLLLDIIRDRLEGPDQPKLFHQAYDRWHPRFQAVESTGLGKTLFQMLIREGLPVRDMQTTGSDIDKLTRAHPAAIRMESGSVYFLKNAKWLPDYEDELLVFDKGTHDDQVDVTAYAVRLMIESFAEDTSAPFIIGI